ncbi:MAG: flippase [Clostridiales bacterium]|nr:flippase [Clostridiales bacterium]
MKNKSLTKNAILNGIRNGLNLLFPLITFPYVSRVLQVEKLGEYNFANSVISYFVLLAGLGISSYAVREGAKLREDKDKFNFFTSSVFTINVLSTVISYICLFGCLWILESLHKYSMLILVFSIQIIFITIGVEWVYSIYEEYLYITLRGILFKILSIIFLFIFVKTEEDVIAYAGITVFASVGSNLLNFINLKKYCKLSLVDLKLCYVHLKPILTLFASSVAVMIYVYSDTTMLGLMKGDYEVGIYSVSTKIYTIMKSMLSSVIIVSIPRVSLYYGTNQTQKFNNTVQKIYDTLMVLVIPIVLGIFILSERIVVFISGKEYLRSISSLRILSIALIFCISGWIFNQCILLPSGKEKIILKATAYSAGLNIGLNFILIPYMSENATAFTTVVSEAVMMIICVHYGSKISEVKVLNRNILTSVFACIVMTSVCVILNKFFSEIFNIQVIIVIVLISAIVYGVLLLLMKNEILWDIVRKIMRRE